MSVAIAGCVVMAASIADIIRERAIANGVDPATLLQFGRVESSLNPNAGASGSSAKGLFQFTNGTAQRYGLSDPFDPVASSDAAARLLKDNQSVLQANGLPVTPGTLYLSHFAGVGGASKILNADDGASAGSILGPAAVRANPFLANMTVGGVKGWANNKMAGVGSGVAPTVAAAGPMQTASLSPPAAVPTAPPVTDPSSASAAPPPVDPSAAMLAQIPRLIAQQTPQMQAPAPLAPPPLPPGIIRAQMLAKAIAQNPLMLSQGVPT